MSEPTHRSTHRTKVRAYRDLLTRSNALGGSCEGSGQSKGNSVLVLPRFGHSPEPALNDVIRVLLCPPPAQLPTPSSWCQYLTDINPDISPLGVTHPPLAMLGRVRP